MANSDAYLIGKAKYKDHDEKKSGQYEELFGKGLKEIDFETVSNVAVHEIRQIIQQIIFIHEMKMNNDYQIKGRCSLYTSLFLIGMDIYFSSSLRAYVSILPSTLLSCLIILMRE